jgi:hypothetical protein
MTDEFKVPVKLFDLGRIVATPGALAACPHERLRACIALHIQCDWEHSPPADRKANFDALFNGERIFSIYPIDPAKPCAGDNRLWIITEADRSATTFLLPDEY